jgi:hypothetical protein
MVDSAATVLLFTAALLAALGVASVGVVAATAVTGRVRRLWAARERLPERNAPTS